MVAEKAENDLPDAGGQVGPRLQGLLRSGTRAISIGGLAGFVADVLPHVSDTKAAVVAGTATGAVLAGEVVQTLRRPRSASQTALREAVLQWLADLLQSMGVILHGVTAEALARALDEALEVRRDQLIGREPSEAYIVPFFRPWPDDVSRENELKEYLSECREWLLAEARDLGEDDLVAALMRVETQLRHWARLKDELAPPELESAIREAIAMASAAQPKFLRAA